MLRNLRVIAVPLLFGLSVGILVGYFTWKDPYVGGDSEAQVRGGGGKFTNPLLECELAKGSIDAQKFNFAPKLNSKILELESQYGLQSMGVYFRDLNNGPTFGGDQDEGFIPASLLKLPIAMVFYKLAESEPTILEKEVLFEKQFAPPGAGDTQYIKPSSEIVVGERYRIQELTRRALVYSDNQAVSLLYQEINDMNPKSLRDLYALLGVNDGVLNGPDATLSVKQYSAFLRILFNASYLNVDHSEAVLSMLSETEYANGIVAGVPKGIAVAHKFGEAGYQDEDRQIHDCGIVYYPKHPYLLCMMSRGNDVLTLEHSIAAVSAFVYAQVDTQYH